MGLLQRVHLFTDSVVDLKLRTYDTGCQHLINRAVHPTSTCYADKPPGYALYFQIVEYEKIVAFSNN